MGSLRIVDEFFLLLKVRRGIECLVVCLLRNSIAFMVDWMILVEGSWLGFVFGISRNIAQPG